MLRAGTSLFKNSKTIVGDDASLSAANRELDLSIGEFISVRPSARGGGFFSVFLGHLVYGLSVRLISAISSIGSDSAFCTLQRKKTRVPLYDDAGELPQTR